MKIAVINGSPKGKYSITLQTTRYLQLIYPEHEFCTFDAGQKIKAFERDFSAAKAVLESADVVLFSYPVYTFLAPSQLHRFMELVKENGVNLQDKYATQITTSKHFYDMTAHKYVEENALDLGMRYIRGLSADMEDLLCEKGQKDARQFFERLVWSVENGVYCTQTQPKTQGERIPATLVEKDCVFYKRPIEKLKLLERKEISILKNGGNYYLIDLGEETVGLPVMEFNSQCKQKIIVAWGEDLQNGHVRRIIGERDFSFEYIAKQGKNAYTNYMLRLGCRYLELYAEQPIELTYLGIIPQIYPVKEKPFVSNELDKQIYDVCVRALKLCMMEHYVDTPWREQCLYAFDSRNQMLCGYYAFENKNAEYAKANLLLMSKDKRVDDLLSICYPCGMDLTIPSFSLYYFMAVREYIEYTGDISLGKEVYEKLISIIETFIKNRQDGLVCTFEGINHWNFYDWSKYMEGKLHEYDTAHPDLMINALFILALENLRYIAEKTGKDFSYGSLIEETRNNARKAFYNAETGVYSLTEKGKEYTVLGNALAILSGIAGNKNALCEKIVSGEFVDGSLSMKCFKYDALLMTDKEKWQGQVLDEIRKDYKKQRK